MDQQTLVPPPITVDAPPDDASFLERRLSASKRPSDTNLLGAAVVRRHSSLLRRRGSLTRSDSATARELRSVPTMLMRNSGVAAARARVHGMFTGNAAHAISGTNPQPPPPPPSNLGQPRRRSSVLQNQNSLPASVVNESLQTPEAIRGAMPGHGTPIGHAPAAAAVAPHSHRTLTATRFANLPSSGGAAALEPDRHVLTPGGSAGHHPELGTLRREATLPQPLGTGSREGGVSHSAEEGPPLISPEQSSIFTSNAAYERLTTERKPREHQPQSSSLLRHGSLTPKSKAAEPAAPSTSPDSTETPSSHNPFLLPPVRKPSLDVPAGTTGAQTLSFADDGHLLSAPAARRTSFGPKSSKESERAVAARRSRVFGGFDDEEGVYTGFSSDGGSSEDSREIVPPHTDVALGVAGGGEPPHQARRLSFQKQPGVNSGMSTAVETSLAAPSRKLSLLSVRQPLRSFRRQSYASAEAQQSHSRRRSSAGGIDSAATLSLVAPRKHSVRAQKRELSAFEEFQHALHNVVDHQGVQGLKQRTHRRGTLANLKPLGDAGHSRGEEDSELQILLNPPASRSAVTSAPRRGTVGRRRSPGSDGALPGFVIPFDSDGEGDAEGDFGTSRGSNSGTRRGGATRFADKDYTGLIADSGASTVATPTSSDTHAAREERDGGGDSSGGGGGGDEDGLAEVEMHLARSSLNPIPLKFVVKEIHERISRDRMLLDLLYFIPFVLVFTLNFIGRDISNNFYAAAAINSAMTASFTYQPEVEILNEYFRIDTQWYSGNESVYMASDGTNVQDQEYGPQTHRIAAAIKWLPVVPSFLDIKSKTQLYRWLEHAFVPQLWDCTNPDYQNSGRKTIRGNSVVIGAARIRSTRVRRGCDPNSEVWQGSSLHPRDLSCYDLLNAFDVDDSVYCDAPNPAVVPPEVYDPRLSQITLQSPFDDMSLLAAAGLSSDSAASSTGTGSSSDYLSGLSTDWNVANETLFPFLDCVPTSTTGVSQQTVFDLKTPCSGHYVTLPFRASCNAVRSVLDVLRPQLITPLESPYEASSDVLHQLMEEFNTRVPSNSCQAFLFHQSVRFLSVDFFSYSLSTDSFMRTRAMIEIPPSGKLIPTYHTRVFKTWTTNSIFQVLLQGVVLVFVARFVYQTAGDWTTHKKLTGSYLDFLRDPWNVLDVANNVTLLASAILTALWWSSSLGIQVTFNRDPRYPDKLERIEELFSMQVYCNAVNVMMIYLKVLKFLRINGRLSIMTRALGECQQDIVALLLLFLFIHTGFSVTATAIYGSVMNEFRSVDQSFSSLLLGLIASLDYETMHKSQRTLTPLFYFLYIVMERFLLLNFFIAILSQGFAQVNQSMHLPSLDMAMLRVVDELRMFFRWKYLRELLMTIVDDEKRTHVRSLVDMHGCLSEHLRLSQMAVEDLRLTQRDRHVLMYFRDMEWWLPADLHAALGSQYLLLLWEDMLYSFNIKEKLNYRTSERNEFARSVRQGVEEVTYNLPDVLSLEVQGEVLLDKLDKLPRKLVDWTLGQEQLQQRFLNMNDKERRLARKQAEMTRRRSFEGAQHVISRSQKQDRELNSLLDFFSTSNAAGPPPPNA